MKKVILQILYFFLFSKLFSIDLSGIWLNERFYYNIEFTHEDNYSWGKDRFPRNSFDISIDDKAKQFEISGFGKFPIRDIQKLSDSEYILTFYFDRGDFDVKYKITLLTDKEMIVKSMTDGINFISEGDDNHYYRISGPKDVPQYSKPITAIYIGEKNREIPLEKNEKIRLIGGNVHSNKNNEVIKYWYVTENNEYGYVETSLIKILDVDLGIIMKSNDNLRIREEEKTSSKIITTIMKGTNVKILKLGKEDNIDGINSKWVKVEIQNGSKDRDGKEIKAGTVGWCYGGYLE